MRRSFADMDRLKATARENLRSGNERVRRWWCDKYKRPPNHPLFVGRSYADWTVEMVEDLLERRDEIEQQIKDGLLPASKGDLILQRIAEALGEETEGGDALFDQWERDIAEGRIPDLEAS